MKWPVPLPTDSIDALAYYGVWPHWPAPASDEEGLLRQMDRLGIRSAVVLSLAGVYSDALAGNDELAGLVRRHPGRFAGMATFDPRRPVPPNEVLERARDAGLSGLALFPIHHAYTLGSEPLVEQALSLAANWRWPVVIPIRLVMSWSLPFTPIETILEAAKLYPGVDIVVAGANYGEFDQVLRAIGELTNIHAEISCHQGANALVQMVNRGDPERVLFGTGQPIQMPECNLIKLATARINDQAKEAILRANAARLFRL